VIRKLTASSGHWSLITGHCAAAAAAYLFACAVAAAGAPAVPPPGAASCTGCHAADAKIEMRVPRIAGRPPAEIVAAMEAFRSGQKPATVMDRIAKGFTEAEIRAIAEWLGAQN
jgi:cytochrome subunit of sulfide dehydrogenase